MYISLKAKNKLGFGFIDQTSDNYMQLHFINSMVIPWILNEAYIYTNSTVQLWTELEEKYGESDKPQIFMLQILNLTMHEYFRRVQGTLGKGLLSKQA